MADNDAASDARQLTLGEIVTGLPAARMAKRRGGVSRVQRRLIEEIDEDERRFSIQHTVFCQVALPYRDPGEEQRRWRRAQGRISLEVQAGSAINPATMEYVDVGLPWGTKPRLILAHLNGEALRQNSRKIEVESSLSAFVKRIRGFDGGREIRAFRDQLTRLSCALVRLGMVHDGRVRQISTQVVSEFDLWPELDARQRVLWPTTIKLSTEYFESLQAHAVPLNESDLGALAHSALALDLYAWLALRLHRIPPLEPVFVTWAALKEQFGPDYGRVRDFRRVFQGALRQVRARYDRALIDLDGRGITLRHSLPPVAPRAAPTG